MVTSNMRGEASATPVALQYVEEWVFRQLRKLALQLHKMHLMPVNATLIAIFGQFSGKNSPFQQSSREW
jgi:hypothetical protein